MKGNQQKNRRLSVLILLGVFALILLAMGFMMLSEGDAYREIQENGAPDFNTLTIEQIGELPYVSGNIELVLDCFAETYTTNYGVRTSDDSDELYYLVPAAVVGADGYYDFSFILCVEAQPKHFDRMDQIMEETWAEDFVGEYTTFEIGTSKVGRLSNDLKGILDEYCEDVGLIDWLAQTAFFDTDDEAEVRSRILPYVIHIGSEPVNPAVGVVLLVVGLALLGAFVFVLIKKPKQPPAPEECPYAEAQPDSTAAQTVAAQPGQTICPYCGASFAPGPDGRCPYCGSEQQQ